MQGRLQETALVLMPRTFAVEQPFPKPLLGHITAAALLKGAVLPDEYLMEVFRMAEEHRAFRAEPEGDDIAVVVFEPTQTKPSMSRAKASRWAPGTRARGPGGNGVTTIPGPSVEVWHLVRVSVTTVWALRPYLRPVRAAAGPQNARSGWPESSRSLRCATPARVQPHAA